MENRPGFQISFFDIFTRELVRNSAKAEEISSQKLLRERIKKKIEERIKNPKRENNYEKQENE